MQYLGDDVIHEEGSAEGGYALWDTLAAVYKDRKAYKQPCMMDKMDTLKFKSGEAVGSLWSHMTILRSDLKGLGYECTDNSIVQCIYRNLQLQPV